MKLSSHNINSKLLSKQEESKKKLRLIFEHLMRFSFPNLLKELRLLLTTRLFLGIKYWKPIHMQMPDIPELQLFFWEALKWNFLMLLS